jgi:hypothetical protein
MGFFICLVNPITVKLNLSNPSFMTLSPNAIVSCGPILYLYWRAFQPSREGFELLLLGGGGRGAASSSSCTENEGGTTSSSSNKTVLFPLLVNGGPS